jgi:hypothetical protein
MSRLCNVKVAGIENGNLLNLVDGHFDVMVLADKNLRYQQNLASRRIALVELPSGGPFWNEWLRRFPLP